MHPPEPPPPAEPEPPPPAEPEPPPAEPEPPPSSSRKRLVWAAAGAAALVVAGVLAVLLVGSDEDGEDTTRQADQPSSRRAPAGPPPGPAVRGDTLTIYSSLPLQGPSGPDAESANDGARLALREQDGRAGRFKIRFEQLDDSTAVEKGWDRDKTRQNAREAVRDETTIAYIGEFNSPASAISIPILNRATILQVSPSTTAVGLTEGDPPGALLRGEPDRYYPTGKRTYGRVIPNDNVQARVIATDMKSQGCTKVFLVDDGAPYGRGVAATVEQEAADQQLEAAGSTRYSATAASYESVATRVARSGADCFLGSLITANNGVQLFEDVAAANPRLRLWGPDGVADPSFTNPDGGGVPAAVGDRMRVTTATLEPAAYPPEGRRFFESYAETYGEEPEPYAIYGYEAMSVILDAIERAGRYGNYRQAVIDQFFRTRGRRSVLGTYDIDRNGDTTLADYGIYTIDGGRLAFDAKVTAPD